MQQLPEELSGVITVEAWREMSADERAHAIAAMRCGAQFRKLAMSTRAIVDQTLVTSDDDAIHDGFDTGYNDDLKVMQQEAINQAKKLLNTYYQIQKFCDEVALPLPLKSDE